MRTRAVFIVLVLTLSFSTSGARAQLAVDKSELTVVGKMHYTDGVPFTGTVLSRSENTDEPIKYTVFCGLMDGVLTGFYDEERTRVKWQVPVADGNQDGLYVHYYENGNINFTVRRIKNKLQGTRHCFREDGTPWHIHHYCNNREHGLKVMFYPGGELWQELTYRKDVLHGPSRVYHRNGAIKMIGRCRKGELRGVWKTYNEEGTLINVHKYRRNSKSAKSPMASGNSD